MMYRTKAVEVIEYERDKRAIAFVNLDTNYLINMPLEVFEQLFEPIPEQQEQPNSDQLDMFDKKDAGLVFPNEEHNQ